MNMAEIRHLETGTLRGRLLLDESMAKHVSWRAGGHADRAYIPADLDDLAVFLRSRPAGEALCFVGLGSNLLVRDGGFRGTVVLMHSTHGSISVQGNRVVAAAGVAAPKVARFAATHAMAGAEFLAGIPGTVGGALAMNAGCYGSETWEFVETVRTLDRHGALHERARDVFDIGYRHCVPKALEDGDEWFVEATFRFRAGDATAARQRIRELLARRIASQPLGLPNAGSVFRNPEGDFAARLIEAAGLKGFASGGAQVSEKHANFIVNPEHGTPKGATAADIEALIVHVRRTVLERFGVDLIPEVRIIGEAP
jgi:UDP-N-acetylmuramate dehydrogenase